MLDKLRWRMVKPILGYHFVALGKIGGEVGMRKICGWRFGRFEHSCDVECSRVVDGVVVALLRCWGLLGLAVE